MPGYSEKRNSPGAQKIAALLCGRNEKLSVNCASKEMTMGTTEKTIEEQRAAVKQALVRLFGLRLQSLIQYEDAGYTEKIVEYLLCWMEQLSKRPGNRNQYRNRLKNMYQLLNFNNGTEAAQQRDNNLEARFNGIKELCAYVEYLYNRLAEQVLNETDLSGDVRKKIGEKFKIKMKAIKKDNKSNNSQEYYHQLNVATLHRNTFFHEHEDGDSKNYKGYQLLIGYEILMACLLYSYYKMVFDTPKKTE